MNELTIKGTIRELLPVQSGTSAADKEWQKQEFIVDNGEQYNNIFAFGVFGAEKVKGLEQFKAGDVVTVKFNVDCREYKGRYYTNLQAWNIAKEQAETAQGTNTPPF